jgi:hypothetical protein
VFILSSKSETSTTSLIALNNGDTVTYVLNDFRKINTNLKPFAKANKSEYEALMSAKEYLNIEGAIVGNPKSKLVYFESIDNGLELAWQINIVAMKPMGDWLIVINAIDGSIIHVEDIAMYHNGSGMVYDPDPITTAQTTYGGDFIDNNDQNNSALQNQRIQVTLRDLSFEDGLYKLKGPYCVLEDIELPSDAFPELTDQNGFNFTRDQQEFEDVMTYYHIDKANRRVSELGYSGSDLQAFRADPHGLNGDANAKYSPSNNYVAFGEGQIDYAEDADIIWHEFGHALQYNVGNVFMNGYIPETKAIMEGSADYWAISYSRSVSSYDWASYANWVFHHNYFERRADLNWVYPNNYDPNDSHKSGQIWSSALMKIWDCLGRDISDNLFLKTHYLWGTQPSMMDAAEAYIQADLLLYNGSHLCTIIETFRDFGLTDRPIVLYVRDETYTNDTKIIGSFIEVFNTKIQNNKKLFFKACDNVRFNENFEVELGSQLECF